MSRPLPVAGITLFSTQAADGTQRLSYATVTGGIVDVVTNNPDAVFDLSNASIEAITTANVSRIVVPYFVRAGMHEWGYEKFKLHVAELDVDRATQAVSIVNRDVDLGLDALPGAAAVLPRNGSPVVVFTFREWINGFVDYDGDGYFGDIIAIHSLTTHETYYTHLKSGGGIFGFVNETECAVNPGTEVDGLQMIAGGANGLIAFTSQELSFAPANGDVPCDRPGVTYNNDGDTDDTAIRYATVDQLLDGQGLTLGPIVTDWVDDELIIGEAGPPGFMIGTDGATIFFAPNAKTSFVVHAFDVASGATTSLDASILVAPGISRTANGMVSFGSADTVLRFYERSIDTLVTTDVTMGNGFVPPATDGDAIVYGVMNGANVDLKLVRVTTPPPPPPPPPPPNEIVEGRMKGDGSLRTSVATARFDFAVRERDPGGERGKITLDVNYSEKRRRSDTFKSRSVAAVEFGPGDSVVFSGSGEWNGVAGYTYVATAVDKGEPGRLTDTFSITVKSSTGATAAVFSGAIHTGNIQSLPVTR